jgi:hypothetical protein
VVKALAANGPAALVRIMYTFSIYIPTYMYFSSKAHSQPTALPLWYVYVYLQYIHTYIHVLFFESALATNGPASLVRICLPTNKHTYIHTYIYFSSKAHLQPTSLPLWCVPMYKHSYLYIEIYACVCIYIYTYTHTYNKIKHSYIYIYIYIYMHTQTHIFRPMISS